MSIAIVTCRAQLGLHAPLVQVEVSLGSGLPAFNIVGLPATVVKESRDRVRAALANSNFEFPAGRITVNLSPADLPKRGGRFDLPIALGILLASEQIKLPPTQGHDPGEIEFYGGSRARPGEISLAHHGVLFLDELLEYDRRALEALREPLESGVVSIARATYHTQYPAQFQLVAAMNPCPCGRCGDPLGDCRCTPGQIAQYRARVSAPLLERFDIHLEVPRVDLAEFDESALPTERSADVAARVMRAREIQLARQGKCNARLSDAQIDRICSPDKEGRALLDRAMKTFGCSARARQRILKLARTIADLKGDATVGVSHVGEAVTYRSFDRRTAPPQKAP